jgi:hypothetical protein
MISPRLKNRAVPKVASIEISKLINEKRWEREEGLAG